MSEKASATLLVSSPPYLTVCLHLAACCRLSGIESLLQVLETALVAAEQVAAGLQVQAAGLSVRALAELSKQADCVVRPTTKLHLYESYAEQPRSTRILFCIVSCSEQLRKRSISFHSHCSIQTSLAL